MSKRILINGWFLTQRTTGIQRVAQEVLKAVDATPTRCGIVLLTPRGFADKVSLSNVRVVEFGMRIPIVWEQLFLPFYAWIHGFIPLSFCNVVPFMCPGIVCIHDIFYKTMPHIFQRNIRGIFAMIWHRLHYWWAVVFSYAIFTDSEYSKSEMLNNYRVRGDRGNVVVIPLGWEHICRIVADDSVFLRFPHIVRGEYYFILGSLNEYKNLRWVYTAAMQHPECSFVVTGKRMLSALPNGCSIGGLTNITFTGYLNDSEMKSMLVGCKALLQPSKCEGFGLPPLEALALGRPIIVTRRTSLPEIYGSAAHYIENPEDYSHVDPDALLLSQVSNPDDVLVKYTWKNAAVEILRVCEEFVNE